MLRGLGFRGFGGRGLFAVQGFTVWDRNLKETDASCVLINLLIPFAIPRNLRASENNTKP